MPERRRDRNVPAPDELGNSATGCLFALAVAAIFAFGAWYFISVTGSLAGIG